MPRRVIICGGPRVGKSTLSERLQKEFGIATLHSSAELEGLFPSGVKENWSASSEFASKWFDEDTDSVCEGVRLSHALRKWLKANPGKPLDADIFLLRQPMVPQRDGQKSMMKAVESVFREIEAELVRRGARVQKLKDPNDAIEVLRSAMPINSDAEAMPVALKRKLNKEEFDKLSDAQKELYTDPGNNGNYLLDAEPDEDTAPLKSALERAQEREKAVTAEAKALKEKYKDFDLEEHKRLKAEAEERAREGKKDEGDWEGWKKTFLDEKAISDKKFQDEIAAHKARIQTFLLDEKIKSAALEAGVRKKLLDHVVKVTKDSFRLDQNEKVEVLDESGNPISVSVEAFFKDKYVTEFPEYYEGTSVNGGSGASAGDNGSRGAARVVSATDQAALNANIEKIAKGEITVQA